MRESQKPQGGRFSGWWCYDWIEKRGVEMIEVTKLNGVKVLVNPHLFEVVEDGDHSYYGEKNNCKRK